MRRRQFITLLGGAAAAWPLAARAQQLDKTIRVGFFGNSLNSPPPIAYYQAFLDRLRELGFTEGQNLIAEYQALNDPRGSFVAAAELMRFQPNVIVASGPEIALQAVIGASVSVPIIVVAVNFDPVGRGYVASFARPGGNITGVVFRQLELAAKQVEVLTQAFPEKNRLAVLWDALTADQFSAAERMAQTLHLDVRALKLENPPYDFDTAFRNAAAGAAQMVLVLSSPFFTEHRTRIAELGIEYRLPTMFAFRHYVDAGGLISYGADFPPMYRRAADYVAKIVKGEKAADLPIEQATKFETVVNLKTASPYRSSRSRHWSRARIRQARAALQPSGNDLTYRFPLIVESVARLRPRSCIIDGEAVVCDGNGMVSFDHIRYRRHDASAFLYAFDLIELNGDDLRRDPLKARKASLANIMARAGHGIWFNDHIEEDGETVFRHACKMGPSKASCRSGRTLPIEAADHPIGLK